MSPITDSILIFSYFKGHGDGLHLAWSDDGLKWTPLNDDKILLKPETGIGKIMRDPCLAFGSDGLFHLVWTSGWHEKGIGYASSPDLFNWSPQQYLGVMMHEEHARNCWAPEIFYDETRQQFLIYWASSIPGRFPETDNTGDDGLNHRMYYVLTSDFKNFSDAKLFFDPGFNVIDATLVQEGSRYVMFMKNESLHPCEKNIRVSVSQNLFSGFNEISPPISGPYWAEGPAAIRFSDNWFVYFDKYKINEMGALRSADLKTWEDISQEVHFPKGAQHGSVCRIPLEKVRHLF